MAGLTPSIIAALKETFSDLVILTPGSTEYEENMLRWNVAAEHKAVSPLSLNGRELKFYRVQ
jgi:hypothetical protein